MNKQEQKGSQLASIGICVVLVTAEYTLFRDNFGQFFGPDAIFYMYLRFHSVGEFLSSLIRLDMAHWYRPLSNRTIPSLFFPLLGSGLTVITLSCSRCSRSLHALSFSSSRV